MSSPKSPKTTPKRSHDDSATPDKKKANKDEKHPNLSCWFDIPCADLKRAAAFYGAVLKLEPKEYTYGEGDHKSSIVLLGDGNGDLVHEPESISATGPLIYLDVNGRIKDAVAQVAKFHGTVQKDVHAIGPHGFRAVLIDSEGNRIALHSATDA